MKYISLGRHCDVVYNIKKNIDDSVPTQFFDWVRTDFKCVLDILKLERTEPEALLEVSETGFYSIFNIENIIIDDKTFAIDKQIGVTLKNFENKQNTLLFRHDIPLKEYNDAELNNQITEFITKYKRRFDRLIELIKLEPSTNASETLEQKCSPLNNKLVFIYKALYNGNINFETDIDDFKNIITTINKNVDYCLVVLVKSEENYILIKSKNYLKINISTFIDKNIPFEWTRKQIDWKQIFNIIQRELE